MNHSDPHPQATGHTPLLPSTHHVAFLSPALLLGQAGESSILYLSQTIFVTVLQLTDRNMNTSCK